MKRTQWVITMHFNRDYSKTFKFDSEAAALECIRITVFNNKDCINFSCHREEVSITSVQDQLEELKKTLASVCSIINKM